MKKQVLSISQMQELIELGIDVSKASMCWIGCADGNDVYPYNSTFKDIFENHKETIPSVLTPTFTLQDILEILPERIKYGEETYILCTLRHTSVSYRKATDIGTGLITSIESDSLLKSAFSMIKWCLQNNYIKNE